MQKPKAIRARRFTPARHAAEQSPQRFFGALTLTNIYGSWWASARDGFFTVRWGRFFAYLHQFDSESQKVLVKQCAAGETYRDGPCSQPEEERQHA